MSRPIIEIRNISKAYRLGAIGATSLREELARSWERLRHRRTNTAPSPKEFWALRDVSIDVQAGHVVGIIGRNGAGKSTLLKIISRITQPTSGEVAMRGRVASLLEIGTGFHPDLSGRENVFLNGAILGMTKAEIQSKLDEIVAFAEIERFLDTPVKRYSSGMYVRLAFAVAAHLEPDILIVDEVLAVGDVAFQRKCLGRMNNVAAEGRTVLFVSHNMAAIRALCDRAAMLEGGRVARVGGTQDVVESYLESMMAVEAVPLADRTDRTGNGLVRFTSVRIESTDLGTVIVSRSRLKITVSYCSDSAEPPGALVFLVGIYDYTHVGVYGLSSDAAGGLPTVLPSQGSLTIITDPINLSAGHCYVNLLVTRNGVMVDYVQHAASFEVIAGEFSEGAQPPAREWVLCSLAHSWSVAAMSDDPALNPLVPSALQAIHEAK